jgi:hypothetical protein
MFVPKANTVAESLVRILAIYIIWHQVIHTVGPDATCDYGIKSELDSNFTVICGQCVRCEAFPSFVPTLEGVFGPEIQGQVHLHLCLLATRVTKGWSGLHLYY